MGLVDAHAYSLLGAYTVTTEKGQKINLVKVRNPWGKREWKGEWCDSDPKWTQYMKDQVKYVDANDGTFFIAFENYVEFFYITTICY